MSKPISARAFLFVLAFASGVAGGAFVAADYWLEASGPMAGFMACIAAFVVIRCARIYMATA